MPAMTVRSLSNQLSAYVQPELSFSQVLNLVMPRIYAMGYWRDLAYELNITTSNGYFALPTEAESVMAATLDGSPQRLWSEWHDYNITGIPDGYKANNQFGVIDDGFSTTKELIPDDVDHQLTLVSASSSNVLPNEGNVYITYTTSTGQFFDINFDLTQVTVGISSYDITGVDDARSIQMIRFEGVPEQIKLIASPDAGVTQYVLAEGKEDFVSRYRRFRCRMPNNGETQVISLLLKRAFMPLTSDSDIVYLGNVNAIKHGILATTAEDNADIERANYHWQVCRSILDEEKDAYRGGTRQAVRIDPYSGNGRVSNMY